MNERQVSVSGMERVNGRYWVWSPKVGATVVFSLSLLSVSIRKDGLRSLPRREPQMAEL